MKQDDALRRLASEHGILERYVDMAGVEQHTSPDTMRALLRANGLDLNSEKNVGEHLRRYLANKKSRQLPYTFIGMANRRYKLPLQKGWSYRVVLEEDFAVDMEGRSSGVVQLSSLPLGVHVLKAWSGHDEQECLLVMAPAKAPSLREKTSRSKAWGINAALYGLHSRTNPEFGSYGELAELSESAAASGADFLGVNPVHAIGWSDGNISSPYSPTHRGFLNTAHIDLSLIRPVSEQTRKMLRDRHPANTHIQAGDFIDHEQITRSHHPILEACFRDFVALGTNESHAEFWGFCTDQGEQLGLFASYEEKSELLGSDWRNWPAGHLKETQASPIARPLDPTSRRQFHAWLQWVADYQLQQAHNRACNAGMGLGLYLDLAVGARRSGAESWCERDVVAQGVSIGAPPDHLSPAGQNWDLSAFAPSKQLKTRFGAMRRILRKTMQHCGIIRIDHILGFDRSFWLPDDGSPGGYIRQDFDALLAITRLEAHRANTVVVGEDLGLVPDGIRKKLKSSGIYSYSVWQFEKNQTGRFKSPSRLRNHSLACFGTHDTPTLSGYIAGCDIEWWQELGWVNEEQARSAKVSRQKDVEHLSQYAKPLIGQKQTYSAALTLGVYGALASSNVAMLSVQLDDIFEVQQAQNLPGTIDEHPNWNRRYELSVDVMDRTTKIAEMGLMMSAHGRSNATDRRKE